MNFIKYYRECFRNDFSHFMVSIPEESRHHGTYKSETTIQYSMLFRDKNHINIIDTDNILNFAISLFFTILVDEVMFTHYKQHYAKFRRLTMYPKFIGDCPGACHYHRHPSDIFSGMNSYSNRHEMANKQDYDFHTTFIEAIPGMKAECDDFIEKHMPEIDMEGFWRRCIAEFPYRER